MRRRFLEEATADMREAMLWYEEQRERLGDEFQDAVETAIAQIVAAPEQFPVYEGKRTSRKFRRVLLKRFPYYIAYEVRSDELLIIAVSHTSRRPGFWRDR